MELKHSLAVCPAFPDVSTGTAEAPALTYRYNGFVRGSQVVFIEAGNPAIIRKSDGRADVPPPGKPHRVPPELSGRGEIEQ